MIISNLASLGEFISGIAVLVSLVYLAFQVRQATLQFKRNEDNASHAQTAAFRFANINSRETAKMFLDGLESLDSLDRVDQFRHDLLLHEFTWLVYQTWDRRRLGISDLAIPKARIFRVLSSSGGAIWWAANRDDFDVKFRAVIDGILDETDHPIRSTSDKTLIGQ